MRKHLVVTDESDEDRPGLAEVGSEIVSALRAQLRHVRGLLKADPEDSKAANRLIAIGNTASRVLEAARKLQADGASAVEQMSFKERADLFIGWFAALPPTYRVSLRAKMDEYEATVSVPQPADQVAEN